MSVDRDEECGKRGERTGKKQKVGGKRNRSIIDKRTWNNQQKFIFNVSTFHTSIRKKERKGENLLVSNYTKSLGDFWLLSSNPN